jgi:hypothetical protein
MTMVWLVTIYWDNNVREKARRLMKHPRIFSGQYNPNAKIVAQAQAQWRAELEQKKHG